MMRRIISKMAVEITQSTGATEKSILCGVLIIVLTLSCTIAEAADDTKLLFLGNKNIAPVVYLEDGTSKGVVVDIVRALATHMPQPVEIKAMDWREAQALVARGDADALIQINQTEERNKIYDFSEPLLESQFSIFTTTNRVGISGISSLRGLRAGVEAGGLPRQVLEKDPLIQLTIIPNFLDGFKLLNEGAIDAVVVDYRVGSYVVAENKLRNINVTGKPVAFSYSAIAVKKGNSKLLDAINNALQIIKADGAYQKIIDKWKPTEVVFQTREQITQKTYTVTTLILLILFMIAAIWTLTLKKELAKRKAAEERLTVEYSTLRGIINSANALIFSVDRQYRYTSFNHGHAAAMKALYGAEIEQGHSMQEYMTVPDDWENARQNFDRAVAGEQIVEEAYSGEELRSRQYFQVSHSPIKSEEGVIGVAVLAQDMTERKRAEEGLAERVMLAELSADIGYSLTMQGDLRSILKECAEALVRHLDVAFARIWTLNVVENVLALQASAGMYTRIDGSHSCVPVGKFKIGLIAAERLPHVTNAVMGDPRVHDQEWARREGMVAFAGHPLIIEDKLVGVMAMFSRKPLTDVTLKALASVSNEIAIGIERKLAEEELKQLNEELEQRVKQRTAELEEKNAELYKMNRLFVGRELRMVELKERIRELEEKSGSAGTEMTEPRRD